MLSKVKATDLFCQYYAHWIRVYKDGAVRNVTMKKYLMTQSWITKLALPGFPWVADLLMSFPEGTNEGYGPIFSDSGADRALVC